jgi:hypothetical protein
MQKEYFFSNVLTEKASASAGLQREAIRGAET